MNATAILFSMLLATSNVPPAASTDPTNCPAKVVAKPVATCELIDAQREQIEELKKQVVELDAAADSYKVAISHYQAELAANSVTIETYRKAWQAEIEFSEAARKRAWWTEKLQAVKWGLLGAAGGILVERIAE